MREVAVHVIRSCAAAVVCACACTITLADEEIDVKPAMAVAEAWLAGVDAGRYGASWEEAAPLFKEAMAKIAWETTIESVRAPLGTPIRKLRQAAYTRVLPNAPEGEYVVIQYDTRFENRPSSTEIVTPMRGRDGVWKVSGYIIR